jgi:hypothetical protein
MEQDILRRAREIARAHAPFIAGDSLVEQVARAVAQGILEARSKQSLQLQRADPTERS